MSQASPDRRYLQPIGLVDGSAAASLVQAGQALPLAGGPLAFTHLLIHQRNRPSETRALVDCQDLTLAAGDLAALTRPRAPFAGLTFERPRLMAVVNVTPDSFSDGGRYLDPGAALAAAEQLWQAGADILDIGAESTRPGAAPLSAAEEWARLEPVFEGASGRGWRLSLDSRRSEVMAAALRHKVAILNDIQALRGDAQALPVAAASQAAVVLMHSQGEPQTMQQDPRYDHVLLDVYDHLAERVAAAQRAGIPPDRLAIDPGIGFGKSVAHNLALLQGLTLFHGLGLPLLVGLSRKSMIARLSADEPVDQRLPGSLAGAIFCWQRGCQLLRVHDLAETRQALALWQALNAG